MRQPLFGPAGNSDSFQPQGKSIYQDIIRFLNDRGLDAYEYQAGHGVRISQTSAAELKALAKEGGITLSLHAPYYISLASPDPEKRQSSVKYILDSAKAAAGMGAERIVVHAGSKGKFTREQALALAADTLKQALRALDDAGFSHIRICPETMGKQNQLGTLDEVLTLCELDERLLPCVDFGHLYARSLGGITKAEDYSILLDTLENRLGESRAKEFHSHFSRIEYSDPGGEKRHLTFADRTYGPDFEPLLELIYQRGFTPIFICESAGTQAEDAKAMKTYYHRLARRRPAKQRQG